MTAWRDVAAWCLGANDDWGTCAFAMCGNRAVLEGRGVMSDGEILNAARQIEGLNTQDRTTDKGENLEVLFRYIQENGWPGDPTLTIKQWASVELADIGGVIAHRHAAESWIMLPKTADGMDYDFTDDALARDALGEYAHAVLPVEESSYGLTFITWARPQGVSLAWAQKYWRGVYDVEWTDIA